MLRQAQIGGYLGLERFFPITPLRPCLDGPIYLSAYIHPSRVELYLPFKRLDRTGGCDFDLRGCAMGYAMGYATQFEGIGRDVGRHESRTCWV